MQFGPVKYRRWPSRLPVSVIGVLLLTPVAGVAIWMFCLAVVWTPLQRYYWGQYVLSESIGGEGNFQWVAAVDRQRKHRLATDADVQAAVTRGPGPVVLPVALSEEGRQRGVVAITLDRSRQRTYQAHDLMQHWIYGDRTAEQMARPAWLGALGVLVLGLAVAIPRDRARRRVYQHGMRLKGPQLMTVKQFNRWSRADGIGFATMKRNEMLSMPRAFESSHIMVMGDSGTGKSALLRQVLMQIAVRGETAIVYDPALEYTPQFYNEARGDVILNPLDARCPYWSPGDEVTHEAEALTLATSLFPDKPRENTFFVEGPRKIFAYLLTLKPTPEKLVWWMSREDEIDQLVRDTELAAFIYRGAGPQRGGVLGALNMVADSLRLLPRENQSKSRWTSVEWAERRQGWIFLTSIPRFRERLLPLTSLWLDTLVLRLMNEGQQSRRAVWFVLDELASLQRLPQLHTALTENRKSNNPVVIGFQGRSQLEARYGHEAEAMLSQPAIKVFLHTSEPRAAKWISDTIGEVEIERMQESVSHDQFPRSRRSKSYHTERRVEPLVLPSEISGMPRLHALVKVDNLVVPFSFPYIELPKTQPGFVQRAEEEQPRRVQPINAKPPVQPVPPPRPPVQEQKPREQQQPTGTDGPSQEPFFS